MCRFIAYRGFESRSLRQNTCPVRGVFFGRREAKSLRTSRRGFEGFGLQDKPRPAACRRIPLSSLSGFVPHGGPTALNSSMFGLGSTSPTGYLFRYGNEEDSYIFYNIFYSGTTQSQIAAVTSGSTRPLHLATMAQFVVCAQCVRQIKARNTK